ncbi:hypothetical protein LCGC14_2028630 [marine sediment metagenome]|uniref:Uncharacterized protein n=1 Tax=marine sediment metagenome TaxID=412755 RepID=A0A0F9EVF5_9ZZZZ
MKILALASLCSVSMLLISNTMPTLPEATPLFLQGGALAVLGWVMWYMLTKAFPAHNKALKDQREDFLESLKQMGEALKEDRKQLYESIRDRLGQ